jgi:hypothetical protein
VVIFVVINLLVTKLSRPFDMTEERLFSLSSSTIELLASLTEPIDIYFAISPSDLNRPELAQINQILSLYANKSNFISYQIVDINHNPALAQSYITTNEQIMPASVLVGSANFKTIIAPHLLLTYTLEGKRTVPASINVEGAVSEAIDYVLHGRTIIGYALTGHGESGLGEIALSFDQTLADRLTNNHFSISSLSLFNQKIPDNADFIAIISPQNDISTYELNELNRYLLGGGRMFIHINGGLYVTAGGFTNLNRLLNNYGLELTNWVLGQRDNSRLFAGANGNPFVFLATLHSGSITQQLLRQGGQFIAYQPLAIKQSDSLPQNISINKVLSTGPQGMALAINAQGQSQSLPNDDYSFAFTVQSSNNNLRIFVLTQEAIERTSTMGGNATLLFNAFRYLAGTESNLHIEPKNLYQAPLQIPYQVAVLLAVLITLVIPLIAMVMAIYCYQSRKNL